MRKFSGRLKRLLSEPLRLVSHADRARESVAIQAAIH